MEPVPDAANETAAAEFDDGGVQFVPERVALSDAHVAADVGENGADGLAEDLAGDLVRGGEAHEQRERVGGPGFRGLGKPRRTWPGGARDGAWRRGWRRLRLGVGVDPGRGGSDLFPEQTGAPHADSDPGEDQHDIGGAEVAPKMCGVVRRVALTQAAGEFDAVGPEFANEQEQMAGAA